MEEIDEAIQRAILKVEVRQGIHKAIAVFVIGLAAIAVYLIVFGLDSPPLSWAYDYGKTINP